MDLKLAVSVSVDNPVAHDLSLDAGTVEVVTDLAEEVAQRLRIRLQFFKGEWFLDTREGIPYFQTVLVKGTSEQTIRAIFSQVVRSTAGILSLDTLTTSFAPPSRTLSLDFTATLEDGRTFTSSDFGPFIVEF